MTLKQAREQAKDLSLKQWNRYFQIHKREDETYYVSRYFANNAVEFYLKGEGTKHIN